MGLGGDLGSVIGSRIGDWGQKLLGFKKGGRVPGKRGKPKIAVIHGGEFILPVGVAPTKAQKSAVAKKQRKK